MVEFGCGTGIYTRLLIQSLHPDRWLLNDLCPEMEGSLQDVLTPHSASPSIRFIPGDAELLPLPTDLRLITSCSTLQWFTHPKAFFSRCHKALQHGGVLAFTTFGGQNLAEIRNLTGHGLDYPPLTQLTDMLIQTGFTPIHTMEEVHQLTFDTPTDVLRHLKQTGVTGTEKRMWTRSRLQTFTDNYTDRFGTASGHVTLTYHPIYMIVRNNP